MAEPEPKSPNPNVSPKSSDDGKVQGTPRRTTPVDTDGYPPGIPYIIGNEAAERFSFYGMKGILFVFMVQFMTNLHGEKLGLSDEQGNFWYHQFVAAVYLTPFIGALLADGFWGKYKTIIRLSIVYCLGHFALACGDNFVMVAIGLSLIALGAGGIKPCVSANVGDQFGARNSHLLDRVFSWFYFSINVGSLLSTLITPKLLHSPQFGPAYAFGLPGVLMLLATIIFWMGRDKFTHVPPAGATLLRDFFSRDGWQLLMRLGMVYFCIALFWSAWEQHSSSWIVQAGKLNRDVSWLRGFDAGLLNPVYLDSLGREIELTPEAAKELNGPPPGTASTRYELLPSQVQSCNPFFVLLFLPLFSYVVYPLVGKVARVTMLRKMTAGFVLASLAWGISLYTQMLIRDGARPYFLWQIVAHAVLAASEVLISQVGLEFSYSQAPKNMKSVVMAMFFLAVTIGNWFTSLVNLARDQELVDWTDYGYFWFFQFVLIFALCLFVIVSFTFRETDARTAKGATP